MSRMVIMAPKRAQEERNALSALFTLVCRFSTYEMSGVYERLLRQWLGQPLVQ